MIARTVRYSSPPYDRFAQRGGVHHGPTSRSIGSYMVSNWVGFKKGDASSPRAPSILPTLSKIEDVGFVRCYAFPKSVVKICQGSVSITCNVD